MIITGANSGIGKATALNLAEREARVILACRDEASAVQTARDIQKLVYQANVVPKQLDLSCLQSIKKFAEEIIRDEQRIDVLVNNAGVAFCPFSLTKNAIEMQMGVNYVGHFFLTNLLLDKMLQLPSARIVVVTSALAKHGVINIENIFSPDSEGYNRRQAYSNSKLANNLFSRQLAKRLEDTNIRVYAVSPGLVWTNLGRHNTYPMIAKILAYPLMWVFLRTSKGGSQTVVHCAVDENLDTPTASGKYYRDCKEKEWDRKSLDDRKAELLWEVTEKLS